MSQTIDPPRSAPTPAAATAADDVAIGDGTSRLRRRWWWLLLAVALAVGAGLLLNARGAQLSMAETQVYLGQPLSPSGAQLGIAETQMNTALGLVTSTEFLTVAADEAGVPVANLQRGVRARQLEAPVASRLGGQAQVVVITVELLDADNAETVARSLAEQLIETTNEYALAKRELVGDRLEASERSFEEQRAIRDRALAELESSDASTFPVWAMVAELASSNTRTAELDVLDRRTELNLLDTIEQSRILTEPTAAPAATASAWTTAVVWGAIGLLAGLLLALAWPTRREPA